MKKKNGQNFLLNKTVIKKMLKYSSINKMSNIIEVGTGFGILTLFVLKEKPLKIYSIELDKSFNKYLTYIKKKSNAKIIFEDALKFKEDFFFKNKCQIIANIPYNISTNLITKWLRTFFLFEKIIVLVPEEMKKKFTKKNNKNHCRLNIISQLLCRCSFLLNVSANNFWPMPNIESSVMKITTRKIPFNKKKMAKLKKMCDKLFNNGIKKNNNMKKNIFQKIFYRSVL